MTRSTKGDPPGRGRTALLNRSTAPYRVEGGSGVGVRVGGTVVLGLSGCGYPLTQWVGSRWGRPGAAMVASVCVGLAIRDGSMTAYGIPNASARFRRTAVARVGCRRRGLRGRGEPAPQIVVGCPNDRAKGRQCRHSAAHSGCHLVGLHTLRLGIYLRPDQGRGA
jgi:hypothetical protein